MRVIVLTTFNLDDRAATAIRYGASGFLLKGTTPVMLRDAIRTVHAGNAVLAPQRPVRAAGGTVPVAGHRRRRRTSALTDKEREVFDAVARGLSNTEVAGAGVRQRVDGQDPRGVVLRKLGLRDRVQIVVFAHEHGLRWP